jgi:CarD family transcriptional regulator
MYKVNDYVVYGLTGVCRILDIGKDEYTGNDETQYYVLKPVDDNNMTIRVPVDNENILLRPIITKDEVLSLIATMPEKEIIWPEDERRRSADFKTALKSGKNEEWIKIIKTLHSEKETRAAVGKKLPKMDEAIMNTAEKHLNQEFALALGISPEEVIPYILDHIPEK